MITGYRRRHMKALENTSSLTCAVHRLGKYMFEHICFSIEHVSSKELSVAQRVARYLLELSSRSELLGTNEYGQTLLLREEAKAQVRACPGSGFFERDTLVVMLY